MALRANFTLLACLIWLVQLHQFLLVCTAQSTLPPPRQGAVQQQVWEAVNEAAITASAAATPRVLEYLDSSEFRSQIADIDELNGASAQEILDVLRSLIRGSTYHHNFPVLSTFDNLDVGLNKMMANGFVPNVYTAVYEGELPYFPSIQNQYNVEMEVMGYPPFVNATSPTLAEALERPSYTCGNIYRVAGGCFSFGDLSLQINPSWIQNMTILSAVDTGSYYVFCLENFTTVDDSVRNHPTVSRLASMGLDDQSLYNCSAWNGVPGTFNAFDHIILGNFGFWKLPLGNLLKRYYLDEPFLLEGDDGILASDIGYIEGDVSGAILFPEAVSALHVGVVGAFAVSNWTEVIRNWSISNSWPLIWYQGLVSTGLLDNKNMFIDPFTARLTTNLSISDSDLEKSQKSFLAVLNETTNLLESHPGLALDSVFWYGVYKALLFELSDDLRLEYPKINACVDATRCFAVQSSTGDCVCSIRQ
eukprot:TRINITY_DN11538_c0_g1_i1.p1 TRINITY_DN11538_c0_g1~~TRINITY_DN11538_c0_g1_i1.p1  ORF type:complete len:476 (+),score=77.24 TRINITY_DN11538_c0_g1_i1:90-1517(+)